MTSISYSVYNVKRIFVISIFYYLNLRDEDLIRVLDRLLFYLRFVHSVDYYNHAEYPYEDEMPNRLSINHARGLPPTSKVMLASSIEKCHLTSFYVINIQC